MASAVMPNGNDRSWAEKVSDHLTQHVEKERALLEEYTEVAEGTNSKSLAYLINLLIEDERRHHRLFAELAASLQNAIDGRSEGSSVPELDLYRVDRAEVLAVTSKLLQNEEDDAIELKRLHQELGIVKDTTLWGLLVELMQRDTDKHIAILRFAQRHAKRSS